MGPLLQMGKLRRHVWSILLKRVYMGKGRAELGLSPGLFFPGLVFFLCSLPAGLSALPSWCSTNLAFQLLLAACAAQPSHLAFLWSLQRTPVMTILSTGSPPTLFLSALPGTQHGLIGKRGVGPFPLARLPLPGSKVGGRGRNKSC